MYGFLLDARRGILVIATLPPDARRGPSSTHRHAYSANYALRSVPGVAEKWLDAMAAGARANDATVQYCMALPRHILQSTRYAEVTHARASV